MSHSTCDTACGSRPACCSKGCGVVCEGRVVRASRNGEGGKARQRKLEGRRRRDNKKVRQRRRRVGGEDKKRENGPARR